MTTATPASNILVAAIIAIIFGLIAGIIGGGIAANTQLISLVAIFSFVAGVLSPWLSQSLAAKRQSSNRTSKKAKRSSRQPASSGQNPDGSEQVTLYVGNLPFKISEETVKGAFAAYGEVFAVRLVKDRRTGKKKGYGFVEMDPVGSELALAKLNDTEFEGRTLKVRFANTEPKS